MLGRRWEEQGVCRDARERRGAGEESMGHAGRRRARKVPRECWQKCWQKCWQQRWPPRSPSVQGGTLPAMARPNSKAIPLQAWHPLPLRTISAVCRSIRVPEQDAVAGPGGSWHPGHLCQAAGVARSWVPRASSPKVCMPGWDCREPASWVLFRAVRNHRKGWGGECKLPGSGLGLGLAWSTSCLLIPHPTPTPRATQGPIHRQGAAGADLDGRPAVSRAHARGLRSWPGLLARAQGADQGHAGHHPAPPRVSGAREEEGGWVAGAGVVCVCPSGGQAVALRASRSTCDQGEA